MLATTCYPSFNSGSNTGNHLQRSQSEKRREEITVIEENNRSTNRSRGGADVDKSMGSTKQNNFIN